MLVYAQRGSAPWFLCELVITTKSLQPSSAEVSEGFLLFSMVMVAINLSS